MEISRETLKYIVRETKCPWTRGYITCILHKGESPAQQEARQIITAAGPQRKIDAIKNIRQRFGLDLKEAKYVVDEFYSSGRIVALPEDDGDGLAGAAV